MKNLNEYPANYLTGAQIADGLTEIADLLRELPADVRLPRVWVWVTLSGYHSVSEELRVRAVEAVAALAQVDAADEDGTVGVRRKVRREWPAAKLEISADLDRKMCGCGLACGHGEPSAVLRAVA